MTVTADVTARALGREDWEDYPAVLATPIMIAQMERACAKLLAALLEPGQLSVGVKVAIAHFNPSPVGATVVTHAKFLHREDALYWFEVWAQDPAGMIGKGRHARAIVDHQQIERNAADRV